MCRKASGITNLPAPDAARTGAHQIRQRGLDAVWALIHPDDLAHTRALVTAAAKDAAPIDAEIRMVPPGELERLLHVRGTVERDRSARPALLHASVQDVTGRRSTEQALNAAAAEHRIAEQLQRSLLPETVDRSAHLQIATYYRAGVEGTQVGGDWYDVIALPAGRTALVLGDVMGRGIHAATVMGRLRATVRAYARLDLPPAELLYLLDAAVREISEAKIVTCVYAVHDPDGHRLSYANSGHLPPLLTAPGERPRRLAVTGPPLGSGRRATDEQITLPADATLALYTDGLVEHRGRDIDLDIGHLAALLTDAHCPLAELPATLVTALLPEGPEDDIAMLLARIAVPGVTRQRAAGRTTG